MLIGASATRGALTFTLGAAVSLRQHELVDVGRVVAGAEVHLLGALVVHDVHDEFAGGLDVTQRVLLAALARRAGERDGRRLAR